MVAAICFVLCVKTMRLLLNVTDAGQRAMKGRLQCKHCFQVGDRRSDTPWRFQACDVIIFLVADRRPWELPSSQCWPEES